MTQLSTLCGDVAAEIGLNVNTSDLTQGDGPFLVSKANEAVLDMLLRTHVYVTGPFTITLTSGVGDYTLDSSILAIEDMYLVSSGANFRIRRLSSTDLLNLRLFSVTTSPIQMYAVQGASLLQVYPAPLLADTLQCYYVPRPTAMTAAGPTNDPSTTTYGGIPPEYHPGLELYMMWKAATAFDDGSSSNGEAYRRLYLGDPTAPPGSEQKWGFIGTMKRDLRGKGGKHLAGIVIPPRNRRIYVPNPGVDVGSNSAYY